VSDIGRIVIPLPFSQTGEMNAWLLRGDPLTLVDTGLRDDTALAALERGLCEHGVRLEDIELVLCTHHHIEHVGLAAEIRRRSGATVAALDRVADRCAAHDELLSRERRYMDALMATHGVPGAVIKTTDGFWEVERRSTEDFDADLRLTDGERVRAGGRDLRVIFRPGHSRTDTLFVDDANHVAFVGDHLLAAIASNTEILPTAEDPRPRARVSYLDGLRATAAMPLTRLFTGHGAVIEGHAQLIHTRLVAHQRRGAQITETLRQAPASAWELGCKLWRRPTVRRQPVLIIWQVLGHLDVLAAAGVVRERTDPDGHATFALVRALAA
jgi:glyoxylase-like metal-dependent hydrolase (beta-lactamase superfamily II)